MLKIKPVKKHFILLVILLLALIFFILINGHFINEDKNIIFISIDTLRQDHVGIYGYDRGTTPEIDALAREGVWFKNSYSTAPWTLPSHMSMFTGLPPSVHKVDFDKKILGKDISLFTEILHDSGYITGAFFSAIYLKGKYGFSRGFDKYSDQIYKNADEITNKAIEWIEPKKKEKFFLFLHYFDVHWPYRPSINIAEKFDVNTSEKRWFRYGKLQFFRKFSDPIIKLSPKIKKKIINLYDGEIFRVDRNIGRLISYLKNEGLYNKTVLVITSDHGEEFKEHESFGHFHQLYSELINVPLIIRYPKKIKGNLVVNDPVSSIDIPATILNLASIKVPDQFKKYGINLLDIINNNNKGVKNSDRAIFSETRKGGTHHFAVQRKGFKYISPYRYQPIIKKKRWIRVMDKLYKVPEDRFDLDNLLSGTGGGGSGHPVILESLKNNISEFVINNVIGIRIVFFPSKINIEKKITGKLIFELSPGELPFGVNFNGEDKIDGEKEMNFFEFELNLGKGKKEIIFPLNERILEMKKMTLYVRSSGKILVNEKINISTLKKPFFIYKGEDGEGSIYFAINGQFKEGNEVELSDKDMKALKTLGYIN